MSTYKTLNLTEIHSTPTFLKHGLPAPSSTTEDEERSRTIRLLNKKKIE